MNRITRLKKTIILALANLVLFNLFTYGQESLQLSDWGVLDPWEGTCEITELSKEEEKLYENISSKAFTWMTGTKEQAYYEPIGELANYFGFARLRNEIREAANDPLADQNLRGTSWLVVLEHLDSLQRTILYQSAKDQEPAFFGFLEERVQLIDMLYGLKEGNTINLAETYDPIEAMGRFEAEVSIISAAAFGKVSLSLTAEQKELFANIRQGNLTVTELKGKGPYASVVSDELEELSTDQGELIKETASKFLSYETGSLEDAIFLPQGKIGNYFGFASYRYEERATISRKQAAELLLSVLSEKQKALLQCLATQVYTLEQSYIVGREGLITDAYPLKLGVAVEEASLVNNYLVGATAEGRMGVILAIYFDYLEKMLSEAQINELKTYRTNTGSVTTNVNSIQKSTIKISNAYPNPFKDYITISYELNQPTYVLLYIYDMQGQKITNLVSSYQGIGTHLTQWDAKKYAAGTYLCLFQVGDNFFSRKQETKKIFKK